MSKKKEKPEDKSVTFDKAKLYHDIKEEKHKKIKSEDFEAELEKLAIELVNLQEWIKLNKL